MPAWWSTWRSINRVAAANAQADASPDCPFAKNLVAESIKKIVDGYGAANPLEYVVIVGNDNVIPFFRHPDQASLANERNYVPPVRDATASQASLRLGYVLGQDRYGADVIISFNDGTLPIPNLGVGRLVETTGEVIGMIDAYLSTPNGVVATPTSSLVTGYDFLDDAANAVRQEFEAGIGNPSTTLIADRTWAPTDPRSWSSQQLSDTLLSQRHDLVFLAGHFSASSALAADYSTRLLASQVANSLVDWTNILIFSAGCHSGYNIVNEHGVPFVTVEPDWAQAFARKKATFIGGTGYQYGDTDFVEYGERLYQEFSKQLRRGQGPVAIGKALAAAKLQYLADTGTMRPIHEKSLLQATLFGLPMLKINMPTGRGDPAGETSVVGSTTPFNVDPGLTLGLTYFDLIVNPTLTEKSVTLKDTASDATIEAKYLSGANGVVTNPAEPVLPLEKRNVTAANTVLRGVGFRGGAYQDAPNIFPLTGAATTEIRGVHPIFFSDTFYPVRPWNINYFAALANGPTWLMALPAQYRSESSTSVDGILRKYGRMDFRLYYSANTQSFDSAAFQTQIIPALAAPPEIARVVSFTEGDNLNFMITVLGHPAAGIQEVWVTHTELAQNPDQSFSGEWRSLNLTQDAANSTQWKGVLPLNGKAPESIRFMVQAVNGVGLVSLDANLGDYYQPNVDPGAPSQDVSGSDSQASPTSLTFISPPTQGAYGTEVLFKVKLESNGTPIPNQKISFALDSQRLNGVTDGSGLVEFNLVLLGLPKAGQASATFAGTTLFKSVSAATAFQVVKQATEVSLENVAVPPSTRTPGHVNAVVVPRIMATLSDVGDRPLGEKNVFFNVTGPEGSFSVALITDYAGRAFLDFATLQEEPLPGGRYQVEALFSGAVTLVTGEVVTLDDDRYNPTSASQFFDVPGTPTAIDPGEQPEPDDGDDSPFKLYMPIITR
ncbi:MAG: hypothetical protein HC802_18700 [Caldilineaceae bacterium]|nr:hypothetical protein [Caldilineaceae bacterium]